MQLPEGAEPPRYVPLAVSVREACRLIGVGNTTLWSLIKDGKLETKRIGRRRLIKYSSLERLISSEAGPSNHDV